MAITSSTSDLYETAEESPPRHRRHVLSHHDTQSLAYHSALTFPHQRPFTSASGEVLHLASYAESSHPITSLAPQRRDCVSKTLHSPLSTGKTVPESLHSSIALGSVEQTIARNTSETPGKQEVWIPCHECLNRLVPFERRRDLESEADEFLSEWADSASWVAAGFGTDHWVPTDESFERWVVFVMPKGWCRHGRTEKQHQRLWNSRNGMMKLSWKMGMMPITAPLYDAGDRIYVRADVPWLLQDEDGGCGPLGLVTGLRALLGETDRVVDQVGYWTAEVYPAEIRPAVRDAAERRLADMKAFFGLPNFVSIIWARRIPADDDAAWEAAAAAYESHDEYGMYMRHDAQAPGLRLSGWVRGGEPSHIFLDISLNDRQVTPRYVREIVTHEATHVMQQLRDGIWHHSTTAENEQEAEFYTRHYSRLRHAQRERDRRDRAHGRSIRRPELPQAAFYTSFTPRTNYPLVTKPHGGIYEWWLEVSCKRGGMARRIGWDRGHRAELQPVVREPYAGAYERLLERLNW